MKTTKLNWTQIEHDTTIWEAPSVYGEESCFRIRNSKNWYVIRISDPELLVDEDYEKRFQTLTEAQNYCQGVHEEMIEDEKRRLTKSASGVGAS